MEKIQKSFHLKISIFFKLLIQKYYLLQCLAQQYLYKINYNGLIIFKTENKNKYSNLGFYMNDVLVSNNSELFHFRNGKEPFFKVNLEKLFIKDFFVINETLYIYDKDHLNKYIISTY